MKVITVTYNDVGISWGPAIHYLELWNCASSNSQAVQVTGIAPSWTARAPIVSPAFPLRQIRVPNIPLLRQVVYDAIVALSVIARSRADDVIYLRLSQFHAFSTLALYLMRRRLFVEVNGLLVDDAVSAKRGWLFRRFVRWQERALMRRATDIIAVSAGIARVIEASYAPRGRLQVFKNGVAGQFFTTTARGSDSSADRPTVIYVGTFTPWDGAGQIVALARRFPSVRFRMVGDGPGRAELERTGPDNVVFEGRVAYIELPALYARADAGIVLYEVRRHTRVELSSLKTLEYLASGLPVFSTNVQGQQFIVDLGCGILTNEATIFEDFARFVASLPSLRATALSKRAEIRRRCSWERVASQTVAMIHECGGSLPV
jgi:glycosyltransferase involved in cell wall biosynthesis